MRIIVFDLIDHSVSNKIGEDRSTVALLHHRELNFTLKDNIAEGRTAL